MEALLLSAGFGTRLRPLTESTPKPLIEAGGVPLMIWHLNRLEKTGIKKTFVNTHYLHSKIAEYLEKNWHGSMEIEVIHEPTILDTGGAVSNIREKISSEELIVINSDLFVDNTFDLKNLCNEHTNYSPEVTILVSNDVGNNFTKLFLDNDNYLLGIGGRIGLKTNSVSNFLGISILSKRFISALPERGKIFSLTTDAYLDNLINKKRQIRCVFFNGFWSDVGNLERLDEVNKYLRS